MTEPTLIDFVFTSLESISDVLKAFHVEYDQLYLVPKTVKAMLAAHPQLHAMVCQPVIEAYMDSVTGDDGSFPFIGERDEIIAALIDTAMVVVTQNIQQAELQKQKNKPKLYGV